MKLLTIYDDLNTVSIVTFSNFKFLIFLFQYFKSVFG